MISVSATEGDWTLDHHKTAIKNDFQAVYLLEPKITVK